MFWILVFETALYIEPPDLGTACERNFGPGRPAPGTAVVPFTLACSGTCWRAELHASLLTFYRTTLFFPCCPLRAMRQTSLCVVDSSGGGAASSSGSGAWALQPLSAAQRTRFEARDAAFRLVDSVEAAQRAREEIDGWVRFTSTGHDDDGVLTTSWHSVSGRLRVDWPKSRLLMGPRRSLREELLCVANDALDGIPQWSSSYGAVDWDRMDITDAEVEALAAVLPGNTTIREIMLSGNPAITRKALQHLLPAIRACNVRKCTFDSIPDLDAGPDQIFTVEQDIHNACSVNDKRIRNREFEGSLDLVRTNSPDETVLNFSVLSSYEFLRDKHLTDAGTALVGNTHVRKIVMSEDDEDPGVSVESFGRLLLGIRSSRVCEIELDGCELPRHTTENLYQACLVNALARVAANDADHVLRIGDVGETSSWLHDVSSQLANNNHVQMLDLSKAPSLTSVGVTHVVHAVESSGIVEIIWPGEGVGGEAAAADEFKARFRPLWERATQACLRNTLRHVAANDGAFRKLVFGPRTHLHYTRFGEANPGVASITQADLHNLAVALPRDALGLNPKVLQLDFTGTAHSHHLLDWSPLINAIPQSGVVSMSGLRDWPTEYGVRDSRWRQSKNSLEKLCTWNREYRENSAYSLRMHRPFQRMLLAALYEFTAASMSHDMMLLIADCLDRSYDCPYRATKIAIRNAPPFAWHGPVARWELALARSRGTQAGGAQPLKRRKVGE